MCMCVCGCASNQPIEGKKHRSDRQKVWTGKKAIKKHNEILRE